MPDLFPQLLCCIDSSQSRFCIALSGGVDSVVLLHLFWRARQVLPIEMCAVHVHHGLNPKADEWAQFCEQLCRDWAVDYHGERVQVQAQGLGIEAAARQARYAVLQAQDVDVLCLAHHQDDQLETFLLGALRGGGLRGLAAMPEWRDAAVSGSLKIWRPLLSVSRAQIEAYAHEQGLVWIHDDSNDDRQHLRNFVRHDVLPSLSARVPNVRPQLLASVAALQDELALLAEYVQADVAYVCQNGVWCVSAWRQLSEMRGRQVLYELVKQANLGMPTKRAIGAFAQTLRTAEQGEWQLPSGRVVYFQDRLLILPKHFSQHWFWLDKPYSGSLKQIAARLQQVVDIDHDDLFVLRAVQPKDVVLIANGQHQNVRKILQQRGVPAIVRDKWPVLVNQRGQVGAVLNVRVAADWAFCDWRPQWHELTAFLIEK